jgi:predicted nucleic acid-binding protein
VTDSVEQSVRSLARHLEELTALIVKMRRAERRRWFVAIPTFVLLLAVVLQGAYFTYRQNALRDCQDRINTEIRQVAKEDRADYLTTWDSILQSKSQAESRKIFKAHLNRSKAREKQRVEAELTRKKC